MPFSTDVRVPRDVEPVFPPFCARCLSDRPGLMTFYGSRFSWGQLFFFWLWLLRKRVRCEVPICDRCRPAVRWRKRLELLLMVGLTSAVVVSIYPWLRQLDLGRQWNKLIVLVAVVVGLLPYILWSIFRPPAFDLTVKDDVVDYEFGNEGYADRFVAANADQVVEVG